eukprot:623128-Rhodomonas_salina.1
MDCWWLSALPFARWDRMKVDSNGRNGAEVRVCVIGGGCAGRGRARAAATLWPRNGIRRRVPDLATCAYEPAVRWPELT